MLDEDFSDSSLGFVPRKNAWYYWVGDLVLALLFEILDYPGRAILTIVGAGGFSAYTLSVFIRVRFKLLSVKIAAICVACFFLAVVISTYLEQGWLYFSQGGLLVLVGIMLVVFLWYEYALRILK